MKVAFGLYRQWGYNIFKEIVKYQKLRDDFTIDALIANEKHQFEIEPEIKKSINTFVVDPNDTKKINHILEKRKVEVIFFYSWSFIVREPVLSKFICLCLHPSPLPKGRGGTPIQNQILEGIKDSATTIFRMNENIDAGPIYDQAAMSLSGDINDIFGRMTNLGVIMTKQFISEFINSDINWKPQENLEKYPPYKRRAPDMSEIKIKDLNKMTFDEVDNLVRGLLGPYPNVFFKIDRNYNVRIKKVEKFPQPEKKSYLISSKTKPELEKVKKQKVYLKLKDGYAKLIKYKIESSIPQT